MLNAHFNFKKVYCVECRISFSPQTAQKPPFMHPSPVQSYGETTPSTPPLLGTADRTHSAPSQLSILSWEQLSCYEGFKPTPVQAGLQSSLRMIVCHTCQVFLKRAGQREELDSQVRIESVCLWVIFDVDTGRSETCSREWPVM